MVRWLAPTLVMALACSSDDGSPASSGAATEADADGDDGDGTTAASDDVDDGDPDGTPTSGDGDDTRGDADATTGDAGNGGACGSPDAAPDLFCPPPGTSWQWQLTGTIDARIDVAVYDVDLFDTPETTIAALHADGRAVICYFSAGSHEDWRPDAADFPTAAIGDPLDDWPGERWLDVRDPIVRDVMQARLDLAVARGCDAVEPDNVDGYANATGFALTADDQLDFNRFVATSAHARGLSVGLKNDLDQIPALVDDFDWALDEECVAYDECDLLTPFIAADKAVFHVEYVDDPAAGPALADTVCPGATALGFSTLIKTWDLDAWRIACSR